MSRKGRPVNALEELDPEDIREPKAGQRCEIRRINERRSLVDFGAVRSRDTMTIVIRSDIDGHVRCYNLISFVVLPAE